MNDRTPADEAFSAFIAGCGFNRLRGVERRMFQFYEANPDGVYRPEIEAAVAAYRRKK